MRTLLATTALLCAFASNAEERPTTIATTTIIIIILINTRSVDILTTSVGLGRGVDGTCERRSEAIPDHLIT